MSGLDDVAGMPVSAAPAIALRIADFLVRTEVERMLLFRLQLAATVQVVSPLLVDLAAMEGISVAGAAAHVHPPQDWPWRPMLDFPPALVRGVSYSQGWLGGSGRNETARFRRAFVVPGVVIRDVTHPRGRFAIRPTGRVLGFCASVGPCLLSAFGAAAMLKLPHTLPDVLTTALPGRMIDGIIDHPVFAGRGYRIIRVLRDLTDDLPVLVIRAPLVPFVSPWQKFQ